MSNSFLLDIYIIDAIKNTGVNQYFLDNYDTIFSKAVEFAFAFWKPT